MVFLDGFDIPVVLSNVANGADGGSSSRFGGNDRESTKDGFGSNLDFIDASNGAAGRVDEQLHAFFFH